MLQKRVEQTITTCLRNKLANYTPESKEMPFHYRLIGKDRMALFSFIHSLNTSFGTSIFEPVAQALASEHFAKASTQHIIGNAICDNSQRAISEILDSLRAGESDPNKQCEKEYIQNSLYGLSHSIKPTKVDLYLEDYNGTRCIR